MRRLTPLILPLCIVLLSCGGGDGGEDPTVDTTDPTITLLQPSASASLPRGNILIRAMATDDIEMDRVEFLVDGAKVGEDETGPLTVYEWTWDSGAASLGAHTIRARAIDTSDNDDEETITISLVAGGPTYHSGEITSDETWYKSGNPHIVQADIGISNGATLTIKPGCMVNVDAEAGFVVGWAEDASLVAVGKPDTTILFTSNESSPARGDWWGFAFYGGTETAHFSYCTIEYAGYAESQAIWLDWNAVLKMDYSTLRESAGFGISYDREAHLEDFDHNTITSCADFPIEIAPEWVRELGAGNDFTGNDEGKDAIHVFNGWVSTTATWLDHGVPYQVKEGHWVSVGGAESAVILTLEPGTEFRFESLSGLSIGYTNIGGLVADGTDGQIVFTSAAESPQAGDWDGIHLEFESVDASTRLLNCLIEYAGDNEMGAIVICSSLPTIEGCSIGHSETYGIYLDCEAYPDGGTLEAENTFYDNASGNVYEPAP
jgi:hypothetical protein